jgi:hypothetical protein
MLHGQWIRNLRPVELQIQIRLNTTGLRSPKNPSFAALSLLAAGLLACSPLPLAGSLCPVPARIAQTPGTRRAHQRDKLQADMKLILCMLLPLRFQVLVIRCMKIQLLA